MDKVSIEEAKAQLDRDVRNVMVRFYQRTGIDDIHIVADTDEESTIGFRMSRECDYPRITIHTKIIM